MIECLDILFLFIYFLDDMYCLFGLDFVDEI